MTLDVEVLDLGINNLASLCRGLAEAGAAELRVIASADESRGADLLVMPGVGNFGAAVEELNVRGLGELAKRHVADGGYLFGVCLGMQLLCTASEESPDSVGLDLVPGRVRRLASNANARVPNIGWSEVTPCREAPEFPSLSGDHDFYFVHSYAVVPDDDAMILATSPFGELDFVSVVVLDRVIGTQFHPEKSSRPGKALLANVLEWARG